jgi:ATP phosphoribosyltransferase regulatory subunit
MRDLLFPESEARQGLARRVTHAFASYGYDLVVTPPFEHADVIERGIETLDRRDLLRFVEPESGEVALLRPDITPQIARVIATRLSDRPGPYRLAYQGTIIRRRHGRARRHRQIAQAGVELVGLAGTDADAEIVGLAARACEAAGLRTARIELRQVRISRIAMGAVREEARDDVAQALASKDVAELERTLARAKTARATREVLLALPSLYGDLGVLRDARRVLSGKAMAHALRELAALAERLVALGLEERLDVDLGETRGMSYYTGASFALLADGPGEPVGAGGRYDDLLGRFGKDAPATGFALDLDNLEWALAHAGTAPSETGASRIALVGASNREHSRAAESLRSVGARVATLPESGGSDPLAFARAWGYDAVARVDRRGRVSAERASDGATRSFGGMSHSVARALLSFVSGRAANQKKTPKKKQ